MTMGIKTRTGMVTLTSEGIVRVRIEPAAVQQLQDAKENVAAAITATAGKRRPLLVNVSGGQPLEPDARHYYSGDIFKDNFTALTMVVDASPFGKMMANVYFAVARPGIPTRIHATEPEAIAWLQGYLA